MQQNLKTTSCLCFPEQFELVVSSFSASEINQQPALSNDFLIVGLITEWTQPDHDKQSMDQTGIMQMSSLHLNPVISGEGKGTRPRGGAHLFYLDGNVPPGWATQIYKQDSLHSKLFQSSYCAKVRAEAKQKGGRGRGKGEEETLARKPHDSEKHPLIFHGSVCL